MASKESLKFLELHYERLQKTNTFEEFKREQLTYVHMLIQRYKKELESKPTAPSPNSPGLVWRRTGSMW